MKKIFFITLLALCSFAAGAQELANFSIGRGPQVVSPEVKDGTVTFRLRADYATTVSVVPSWLGYTANVPMTRGENYVWSVTLPAPEPEIYTYHFVVDGVATSDPQNYMVQRDGVRYLNMVFVDGDRTVNYKTANKRGTVREMWYDSNLLGINRRMTVYTPYGYEKGKQKYPVLYLLHGGGGDEEAWTSMGRAAEILDNLIEKGEAVPMIVVMPNGNPGQQAAKPFGLEEKTLDRNDPNMANAYVTSLVKEIIPFVEKEFRAIPKSSARAIAGLSMGGGHTTSATILFPGTFDYICPMSCGIRESAELDANLQGIKKAGYKLYWIGCGTDDFAWPGTEILDAALTRNGMEHTLFASDGGHTWQNWRLYLNTFGKLLFK